MKSDWEPGGMFSVIPQRPATPQDASNIGAKGVERLGLLLGETE